MTSELLEISVFPQLTIPYLSVCPHPPFFLLSLNLDGADGNNISLQELDEVSYFEYFCMLVNKIMLAYLKSLVILKVLTAYTYLSICFDYL